jgi:RHS repeat-associated protein
VAQRRDRAGAALATCLFDSLGAGVSSPAGPHPFGYGGQWGYSTDGETGLQLLTSRYYDAGAGRFLNRDPIGYDGGINLYGYVENNVANLVDPLGPDWEDNLRYGRPLSPLWRVPRRAPWPRGWAVPPVARSWDQLSMGYRVDIQFAATNGIEGETAS